MVVMRGPVDAAVDGVRRAWVVMGVAGCGKSTIGPRLCEALGAVDDGPPTPPPVFIEGDDYHPAANVAKMSRGAALTEEDRGPWLETLATEVREALARGGGDVVLACSALRRAHRAVLRGAVSGLKHKEMVFLHLDVSRDKLEQRLGARTGHFFSATLLQSQLDALEVADDPGSVGGEAGGSVVQVTADGDVEEVLAATMDAARRAALEARATPKDAPRLDPSALEATVSQFLDEWWARLRAKGLDAEVEVEGRQIDHVCWRCSTEAEFDDALHALTSAGHAVAGSSVIGGRTIATVALAAPVRWRRWSVPAIEVPMPKAGRPKPNGFEHAEVALMSGGVRGAEGLEALRRRHAGGAVHWDDKGMGKDINPELSVDLGDGYCVKFHNRPLLEVIEYEIEHGLALAAGSAV